MHNSEFHVASHQVSQYHIFILFYSLKYCDTYAHIDVLNACSLKDQQHETLSKTREFSLLNNLLTSGDWRNGCLFHGY